MRVFSMTTSGQDRAGLLDRSLQKLERFRREEEGSLLIFGLFCFVIMLMLAGVALDLMRFEERRTVLQNTIDRAALAAADLQQTLPPKEVVKDYFRKAGLKPPTDDQITVVNGNNGSSRKVSIAVAETVPTWFMKMAGVSSLSAPGISTAEESVGQIEISLILDVSGSMNSSSRLTNLKPAAKSFVDQMFDSTEADKITISIIPYATQVSLSDNLMSYFNVTNEHASSNCIEFEPSKGDFTTTSVSFGFGLFDRVYQRNGHFDPFYKASPPRLFNCAPDADREILPFSSDRDELKTFIDGLQAEGNTSIDLGMKWGAALLDPSMQGVVNSMADKGDLPDTTRGRPYAYTNGQVMKIIVLMTDGANTTEYKLRDAYDHNFSQVWRNMSYADGSNTINSDVDQYSFYDPSKKKWYVPALDQWLDHAWGNSTYTSCSKWSCTTKNEPGYNGKDDAAFPLTWPEVWERISIYYLSDNIIAKAYGSSARNKWRPGSTSNPEVNTYVYSAKDDQTRALCDAAKAQDVRIYTIAFEAPWQGQQLLSQCASSDASHYEVEGLDIEDAFSGIVQSINKLRLTH
ncbi:Flp pilus assembly protein TadG [Defluviimonas denitrificans]|jgi:Flp pilus assembly protein TadG|uniref:Flp pilus assembly protein TadG n=1 Tax=Albidovulum denitrificans TaxID=404881 RepID=A0A2S8SDZ8_9RHOB|nr:VWA domain-containing protein [Defluviimonas denitrificans]PQV59055.1 Flp pilus assembly protein TadG [Defluviimonas denitrificans]